MNSIGRAEADASVVDQANNSPPVISLSCWQAAEIISGSVTSSITGVNWGEA